MRQEENEVWGLRSQVKKHFPEECNRITSCWMVKKDEDSDLTTGFSNEEVIGVLDKSCFSGVVGAQT